MMTVQEMIAKLGTKEAAIEDMCKAANFYCLAVHEMWCYKELAAHFGITRGDYYNDYDALSEEDKKYIGDNWKPNTENQYEHLLADLKRESGGFKYFERDILQREDLGKPWFYHTLQHYEWHAHMLSELIGAVRALTPKPEGGMSIEEALAKSKKEVFEETCQVCECSFNSDVPLDADVRKVCPDCQ